MPKYLIKRLIEKSGDDMKNETGKREKLIMSAIGLFAEYGYDKVSIRQIAADAGVNSSMISYYFNGKGGLYEAIIKELLHNFDKFFADIETDKVDPREALKLYIHIISDIHRKYPPHFVKLIYREMLNPTEIFENIAISKLRSNVSVLLKIVEHGKKLGIFRSDLDKEKILLMFVSVINFYFLVMPLHSKIIEQDEAFCSNYLTQVLDIFFNGIEVKGHDKT